MFLRQASFKFQRQLLLALLVLVLKLLFSLAQRLPKLQLLALQPVLLLTCRLLQLTRGILFDLGQMDLVQLRLLVQLRFGSIARVESFFQITCQLRRTIHPGEFSRRGLAARFNELGFAIFSHLHQLFVMFLHQGQSLRLAGGALLVQLLAQLRQTIRPRILAHLNLAFDL